VIRIHEWKSPPQGRRTRKLSWRVLHVLGCKLLCVRSVLPYQRPLIGSIASWQLDGVSEGSPDY
jgi:hypothetical protein